MRFSHFFVDRPIFAAVLSVILTLVGAISYRALPITEFPDIAPPTVEVTAQYPGASAEVLAATVASPIEQEINGVDNMIYMVSQSTGDGMLSIQAVFKPGTDVDQAQVLVQNRVSIAIPRLPEQVQRFGVTVKKKSPDLMLVIHLISPDGTLDQQYISNYASVNIKDVLARIDGVGDTVVFGARDYSMRIWLDPAKLQARGLTATDIVIALRGANVAVSAGALNQPPATSPGGFQIAVLTLGRLATTDQFEDIVVATDPEGRVTRVRDIAESSSARRTTPGTPISTTRSQPPSLYSSVPAPTRSRPRKRCSARWTSFRRASHPGSNTASPTTPPSSSSSRSTRW